MAKICLVRPLLSPTNFNGYPLNLLVLASALRAAGHTPVIRDYDFLKEVEPAWATDQFAAQAAEDIVATDCAFVGITALCSNYVLAMDLAREIKRRAPHVHITMGGPHVSLCPVETLERYPVIDTVVVGEGEVTYPELVSTVERAADLEAVLGAGFRRDGQVVMSLPRPLLKDLNLSPRPAYDLIDMAAYLRIVGDEYLEIYAGSGCPFTCTFCSTSIVWERKYRVMAEERIVGEMELLYQMYGARRFNLIHDNLTVNKPFLHRIAQLIQERNLPIRWGFSSRIDTLDESTAQKVAGAGCDYIFFGVESASETIQRTMRKRLKLAAIHDALRYCIENGIRPTTSFILGFPDEHLDDIEETIRLAYRCKTAGSRRSFINLLSPYTGTPLMLQSYGKLVLDRQYVNSSMIRYLSERHFAEIEADPYIYANYYFPDYAGSFLSGPEYSNLVDFYTICLFKYPFTITYLICDSGVSPLDVFRYFESSIARLTAEERDRISLVITDEDLQVLAPRAEQYALISALRYDESILAASGAEGTRVLYQGAVQLPVQSGPALLQQPVTAPGLRHCLHVNVRGEISTYAVEPLAFLVLRAQGLLSFSAGDCPTADAAGSMGGRTCST